MNYLKMFPVSNYINPPLSINPILPVQSNLRYFISVALRVLCVSVLFLKLRLHCVNRFLIMFAFLKIIHGRRRY